MLRNNVENNSNAYVDLPNMRTYAHSAIDKGIEVLRKRTSKPFFLFRKRLQTKVILYSCVIRVCVNSAVPDACANMMRDLPSSRSQQIARNIRNYCGGYLMPFSLFEALRRVPVTESEYACFGVS